MSDLLDIQNQRLARAARLRRVAGRAVDTASHSTAIVHATPLNLATPGSLNRYLAVLEKHGERAAKWKAKSRLLERQADALLSL